MVVVAGSVFVCGGADVRETQRGVLRVNCMDCLDRTNAAQVWPRLNLIGLSDPMLTLW
jgi:hypothetical protein